MDDFLKFWKRKPRDISLIVDNDSWIIPYVQRLQESLKKEERVNFYRASSEVKEGLIAFYLGCTNIVSPSILRRNKYNLVVHSSNLPKGRGWSPLSHQILRGINKIPVCLFKAVENVDEGDVYYRDEIKFKGHELVDELREKLGSKTIEMCLRFINEPSPPIGIKQSGESSYFLRRRPKDCQIDIEHSILSQFELLRIVDNDRYPAFFECRGHKYRLKIEKMK